MSGCVRFGSGRVGLGRDLYIYIELGRIGSCRVGSVYRVGSCCRVVTGFGCSDYKKDFLNKKLYATSTFIH